MRMFLFTRSIHSGMKSFSPRDEICLKKDRMKSFRDDISSRLEHVNTTRTLTKDRRELTRDDTSLRMKIFLWRHPRIKFDAVTNIKKNIMWIENNNSSWDKVVIFTSIWMFCYLFVIRLSGDFCKNKMTAGKKGK